MFACFLPFDLGFHSISFSSLRCLLLWDFLRVVNFFFSFPIFSIFSFHSSFYYYFIFSFILFYIFLPFLSFPSFFFFVCGSVFILFFPLLLLLYFPYIQLWKISSIRLTLPRLCIDCFFLTSSALLCFAFSDLNPVPVVFGPLIFKFVAFSLHHSSLRSIEGSVFFLSSTN